jgi:hypothetical protein
MGDPTIAQNHYSQSSLGTDPSTMLLAHRNQFQQRTHAVPAKKLSYRHWVWRIVKKKFVLTFALSGLSIAIVLAAVRLYILHHAPMYFYGDGVWFNVLSLILWPSVSYLALVESETPAKVAFVMWSVAILFNAVIYGAVGWLVWRFARFMELVRPD